MSMRIWDGWMQSRCGSRALGTGTGVPCTVVGGVRGTVHYVGHFPRTAPCFTGLQFFRLEAQH